MTEGERQYVVFKFLLRDGTAKPYAVCGSDRYHRIETGGKNYGLGGCQAALRADIHCCGIQRDRKCIAKYAEAQR